MTEITIDTPLSSPALEKRRREFAANGARAVELTGDLSDAQLWWRPAEGRWSVGECLDHLVLADEAYLDEVDPAVAAARAAGPRADGPPRTGLLGSLLVKGVEPPPRVRIPAPRRIQPRRPAPEPVARFLALRDRLARRLHAAEGLALDRVRIGSPFVPLVSVNLHAALGIVAGHERRHLHQADQVLRQPDFPPAADGAREERP